MTKDLLIATNISKQYTQGNLIINIFDKLNLTIKEGTINILMGPSGSGKTSLLNVCGMLDDITSGNLIINNIDIRKLSLTEKTKLRAEIIGFIFQFHHLLPDFTALENVALPLLIKNYKYSVAKDMAINILNNVGLKNRANHYPSQLSGGEQQRVAIARALITKPKLLIADEPTGNLDKNTAQDIFNLLIDLAKQNNTAMLIATHDANLSKLSKEYLTLNNGILETKHF